MQYQKYVYKERLSYFTKYSTRQGPNMQYTCTGTYTYVQVHVHTIQNTYAQLQI